MDALPDCALRRLSPYHVLGKAYLSSRREMKLKLNIAKSGYGNSHETTNSKQTPAKSHENATARPARVSRLSNCFV
jgi:hypothetical protein